MRPMVGEPKDLRQSSRSIPILPKRSMSIGARGNGSDKRIYQVLARLDRGGMGELFLGRVTNVDGSTGYVVLKLSLIHI